MIQLLRHHEIDPARWKACLLRAPQPLVYLEFWYLEEVCAGKWEALVELQEGEYVSLFPVPVKSFLGKKKVYQPLFTQQLGLVVTPASKHRSAEEYLSFMASHYPQGNYQLPWTGESVGNLPEFWHPRMRPNYELSLAPEYAVLTQSYSTNLQRNLKKAAKASLSVDVSVSISPLLRLFQETKGRELAELRPRHYQKLERLYEQAKAEGAGEVWEVREENNLLAAAFLLRTPHRVTFLFGASSGRGREVSAMAFLLDRQIRAAAGSGKTFDFEGSEVPGVANFYAGFGAQPVPYLSLTLQPKPATLPWATNVFTFLAKHLR